jgi:hypothetical protein
MSTRLPGAALENDIHQPSSLSAESQQAQFQYVTLADTLCSVSGQLACLYLDPSGSLIVAGNSIRDTQCHVLLYSTGSKCTF